MRFGAALLLVCLAVLDAQDTVTITSPQPSSLLVWGNTPDKLPKQFKAVASGVNIGPMTSAPGGRNEATLFSGDGAPGYTPAAWTPGADSITLHAMPVRTLPLKVWVICADPACGPLTAGRRLEILTELAGINTILTAQRTGILLDLSSPTLISDQTANAAKYPYRDFPGCSSSHHELVDGIIDKQAINIYIVRTMPPAKKGSTTNVPNAADTCSTFNTILAGHSADAELLTHELGHNLSLRHADLCGELLAAWGDANVMTESSATRALFSEGEIFRMHFDSYSVLNQPRPGSLDPLYQGGSGPRSGARSCPGPHPKNFTCNTTNGNRGCPLTETDLWNQ